MKNANSEKQVETWPDLAIGLYDKLTGRNAAITYDFDEFKINIPTKVGSQETTQWEMSGKITISTSNDSAKG